MTPTLEMLHLVRCTKEHLSTTALPTFDPLQWCNNAGVPTEYWGSWLDLYGDDFESWFCRQLALGTVERAALDRMFWSAVARTLTAENPNAAQLNVWADIQGYKKEKPERNTLPVLSTAQAMEALVGLPPEVLAMALALANEKPSNAE